MAEGQSAQGQDVRSARSATLAVLRPLVNVYQRQCFVLTHATLNARTTVHDHRGVLCRTPDSEHRTGTSLSVVPLFCEDVLSVRFRSETIMCRFSCGPDDVRTADSTIFIGGCAEGELRRSE